MKKELPRLKAKTVFIDIDATITNTKPLNYGQKEDEIYPLVNAVMQSTTFD